MGVQHPKKEERHKLETLLSFDDVWTCFVLCKDTMKTTAFLYDQPDYSVEQSPRILRYLVWANTEANSLPL